MKLTLRVTLAKAGTHCRALSDLRTALNACREDEVHHRDEALAEAEQMLVARGVLKPGDTYAITCGEPMGHPGGTNMLKVCEVG